MHYETHLTFSGEYTAKITMQQAIKSPMFQVLMREDKQQLATVMGSFMVSAMKACGSYDRDMMVEICKDLMNQCPTMKIEEFALIIKNGIRGKYGKIYGQLTLMDIYEWIEKFYKDKDQFLEDEHNRKKHEIAGKTERMNSMEQTWKVIPGFLKPK